MDNTLDSQTLALVQGSRNATQEAFVRTAGDAEKAAFAPFGDDGFSFLDVLDIINPLQHIPVISTLYRDMTGDELSPVSRIAGGTLFGGPIGAAAAVLNVVVEEASGKDLGEHAMALFEGEDTTQVADWPEGGLNPAPVDSEILPPPAGQARNGAPEEDPVTAWARATVNGAQTAAVSGVAADPVSEWAERESRIRVAENEPVPATVDPVANWAAGEVNARHALASATDGEKVAAWARDEARLRTSEAEQARDPVSAWAHGEASRVAELAQAGQFGTQMPTAALSERTAQDSGSQAHRQSEDLSENGNPDRLLESVLGGVALRTQVQPAMASYDQAAALGGRGSVTPAFSAQG